MRRTILVLLVVGCVAGLTRPSLADVGSGDRPSFEVTTVDGDTIDLETWRGKAVLVDFWASWCAPCRASFPFYDKLADEYDEHFRVLAVSVDEKKAAVDEFLEELDVSFPVTIDTDHALASKFEPPTMPTCYLIGPAGKVRWVHTGFEEAHEEELEEKVETLVEEAKNTESGTQEEKRPGDDDQTNDDSNDQE